MLHQCTGHQPSPTKRGTDEDLTGRGKDEISQNEVLRKRHCSRGAFWCFLVFGPKEKQSFWDRGKGKIALNKSLLNIFLGMDASAVPLSTHPSPHLLKVFPAEAAEAAFLGQHPHARGESPSLPRVILVGDDSWQALSVQD